MDFFIKTFYKKNPIIPILFYKIILFTTFLVLTIDSIWILLIMKNKYQTLIPIIQKTPMIVRFLPTVLSYVTIILPIVLFSIPNIRKEYRLFDSFMFGGLLGMFMYGMFSFTNYALIDKWSIDVVLLDTIWGGILYSIVTYLGSYLLLG